MNWWNKVCSGIVRRGLSLSQTPGELYGILGGRQSTAGEAVSPDSAKSLSAYYAAIRNISEDIGKLPLITYRELSPRGREKAKQHSLYNILRNTPNADMTAMTFRETINAWAMGWGNGYAEIERNRRGEVIALHPIHPSMVVPARNASGELVYNVTYNPTSAEFRDYAGVYPYAQSDILHIKGFGDDGLSGHSVAEEGCESLGRALATQKYSAAFFGNDTKLGTLYKHPKGMSDKAKKNFLQSVRECHGGAGKAFNPFILEEGMDVIRTDIPPEQSQLLETMNFTVEDVCRWFRCPPHKVGHLLRATGWSTLEATNTDYVIDTLMPWMVRWEQEIKRKLLFSKADADLYVEHLVTGMLRGDSAARAAYYQGLFNIGALSQNDVREFENQNPIPGGDRYFVPLNMATAEEKDKQMEDDQQQQDEPEQPEQEDDPEQPDANGQLEAVKLAMMPIFVDAAERVLRKEHNAAERARNKPDFSAWAVKFYGEHETSVQAAFTPAAESMVRMLSVSSADSLIECYAHRHCTRSIAELSDTSKWLTERPAAIATELTDLIGELV